MAVSNLPKVCLALGTNLGERRAQLEKALHALAEQVQITHVSALYDTAPVGITDQPRFLNAVCVGQTALSPRALLHFVKGIEQSQGRSDGPRNGPRPLDIDIVYYDRQIVAEADLIIPHPRLSERAFVLVPLAEVAPDWMHPVVGLTSQEMLARLGAQGPEIITKMGRL